MHLGNQGIAFLQDGGALPGGQYPVYASLDVDEDGAALGELHFLCEPKYPPPISVGVEFDIVIAHPESILGDNVNLKVTLTDKSGSITGYVIGSAAQFRPVKSPKHPKERTTLPNRNIEVFISHSSADAAIAKELIELLRSAI
jgi:hypothetical protein